MAVTGKQIEELELYFNKATLPESIALDSGTTITEVPKFIGSHLAILHNCGDKPVYEVFYNRLIKLKELLT